MRKKFSALIALPVALCALGGLVACDGSNAPSASETQLAFDSKYLTNLKETDECKRTYFLFHADGTGEYHYYWYYKSDFSDLGETQHYTLTFDYTFLDKNKETVICTYKSISYAADDNIKSIGTDWNRLLMVSADAVIQSTNSGNNAYFNENYIKAHPEYASKN